MGKLLIAVASFALMLYLPAWIKTPDGEPYLVLRQSTMTYPSTFTEPYHDILKRLSRYTSPKKEEVVKVTAWQDADGNMHFSDQSQLAKNPDSQIYEVKSEYTGRFALPQYWVWGAMFGVWLAIYLVAALIFTQVTNRIQMAVENIRGQKASSSKDEDSSPKDKDYRHIEYEPSSPKAAACKILGVKENASLEDIKIAYRNKAKQYHPDKVSHLGKELQDVARKKTTEINRAYEILTKQK